MSNQLRRRLSIASRVLAASVGGYVLVSVLIIVLSLGLPVARAEAVLFSGMVSFPVYAAVAMAVFHARSATRAWTWIGGAALPLTLLLLLLVAGPKA